MKKVWFVLAVIVCILAGCSDGGNDNAVNPTPKPEEVKTKITIDSGIVSNGLSFGVEGSEQSVSFSVNANWTLNVASITSGATWCKASVTSGGKGVANVKFTVDENTEYDDRSVSVTIKAGSVSKTFSITQKGADALLVTTDKYEVSQEGGQIEIEVKANIDYQMAISENAKSWITEMESKSRALTTNKHVFNIALNEDVEKREGEITFKSGEKVETVKVYQTGGAILLLSQNEYTVSDAGETISVDIKSNVEYGVQMPDVDWITDEASSRGMSSHTLKYVIAPNEGYDSRSAEIIFYDKNSDLKDTLKVVQAQKDAIVISEKNFNVSTEGGTIEVKVNTNVDIEVQIPSDVTWVTQTESRALTEKSIYLKIDENTGEKSRSVEVVFVNKESQISESIIINQFGVVKAGYENGVVTIATAGTMKNLLGDDFLNITSLKIVGPINGDDVYYLRKMLGANSFSEADRGKLTTLDLSEAIIVEGGEWYYNPDGYAYYTSNNEIGDCMFYDCANLQHITLPDNVISVGETAFSGCSSLVSIILNDNITSIGSNAFSTCTSLTSVDLPTKITFIDDGTFDGCSSLSYINLSNDINRIGGYAFSGCSSLTSIIVPASVTSIGGGAFYGCSSLATVKLLGNLKSIAHWTFNGCSSLVNINIPNSVVTIHEKAFYGCSSLISIDLPDSVISVLENAFYGCTSLNSLSIGKRVNSIGKTAFRNCPLLTKCYCYGTTPPEIGDGYYFSSIDYYGDKATLYVPARCGTIYSSSYWGDHFKNIKEMDD